MTGTPAQFRWPDGEGRTWSGARTRGGSRWSLFRGSRPRSFATGCRNGRRRGGDRKYRLPTEAEWNTPAGARRMRQPLSISARRVSSSDAISTANSPYGPDAPPGRYLERTAQVGSYEPNDFGLYECTATSRSGAPTARPYETSKRRKTPRAPRRNPSLSCAAVPGMDRAPPAAPARHPMLARVRRARGWLPVVLVCPVQAPERSVACSLSGAARKALPTPRRALSVCLCVSKGRKNMCMFVKWRCPQAFSWRAAGRAEAQPWRGDDNRRRQLTMPPNRKIHENLRHVINRGAYLYNSGDWLPATACTRGPC